MGLLSWALKADFTCLMCLIEGPFVAAISSGYCPSYLKVASCF
jgi:hypothetical protein